MRKVSGPARDGYRFDELGWLEFEQLAHGLLARDVGVADARWVGRADEGRLAVICGDVALPAVGRAAGPLLLVLAWFPGVGRERLRLRLRDAAADAGVVPRSAVVITNASEAKEDASYWGQTLDFIPRHSRFRLGPGELSAIVDADATLRRRIPSVLGLRDIAGLAEAAALGRSTAELDAARRLARARVRLLDNPRGCGGILRSSCMSWDIGFPCLRAPMSASWGLVGNQGRSLRAAGFNRLTAG